MSEAAAGEDSLSPLPPPLDRLAGREFSFYPSIENVAENLWVLREANWSEFLVENRTDAAQVWVPRRYLGEISSTDRPVMIVGLNRQLELKAGQVWPVTKRVLPMPRVPAGEPAPEETGKPGKLESGLGAAIRLDASEKKVGRFLLMALGVVALAGAISLFLLRNDTSGGAIEFKGVVQESLGLSGDDDYFAVVRKLGTPDEERQREAGQDAFHRLLVYKQRRLNVVLTGRDKDNLRYVGAVDAEWKVVDSVTLKGGSNTYSMLSRMKRF